MCDVVGWRVVEGEVWIFLTLADGRVVTSRTECVLLIMESCLSGVSLKPAGSSPGPYPHL